MRTNCGITITSLTLTELHFANKNYKEQAYRYTIANSYTDNRELTLLHSGWPKLCGVLAILSAIGLNNLRMNNRFKKNTLFHCVCMSFR